MLECGVEFGRKLTYEEDDNNNIIYNLDEEVSNELLYIQTIIRHAHSVIVIFNIRDWSEDILKYEEIIKVKVLNKMETTHNYDNGMEDRMLITKYIIKWKGIKQMEDKGVEGHKTTKQY